MWTHFEVRSQATPDCYQGHFPGESSYFAPKQDVGISGGKAIQHFVAAGVVVEQATAPMVFVSFIGCDISGRPAFALHSSHISKALRRLVAIRQGLGSMVVDPWFKPLVQLVVEDCRRS